jgi:hypothetical protein
MIPISPSALQDFLVPVSSPALVMSQQEVQHVSAEMP